MRPLDPQQAELARRGHLAPLTLLVLTTYTDRDAGMPDRVFDFATHSVVYPYGAAGAGTSGPRCSPSRPSVAP